MPNQGSWDCTVGIGATVTIPKGYHDGTGTAKNTTTNRGAWNGTVGVNGSVTIPEGYHNGQGKVTNSVATMGGQTLTPKASQQTVSCSGKYMTGNIVIQGDADLVASNILYGKNIFGVAGNVRKYASYTFASGPSTSSKTYDYYPSNTRSFYPLNLSLGFYPVTYGYVCYGASSYNGILDKYGTFRVSVGGSIYDVLVNSKLVSGKNLYLPCGRSGKTMDGCVGGYY